MTPPFCVEERGRERKRPNGGRRKTRAQLTEREREAFVSVSAERAREGSGAE